MALIGRHDPDFDDVPKKKKKVKVDVYVYIDGERVELLKYDFIHDINARVFVERLKDWIEDKKNG